jgi:urea transporter
MACLFVQLSGDEAMNSHASSPFYAPYLRGVGQIMLQNNVLTGALFLLGIAINSLLLTLGMVAGLLVGTITAKLLNYDRAAINNGLYGFNAALVGIAMLVFFESTLLVWTGLVLLSVLSTIMMNAFLRKQLPAFTFPFVFCLWIALLISRLIIPIDPPGEGDLAPLLDYSVAIDLKNFGFGFGEVIFQASIISGIVFFLAVYVSNPTGALYGLAGTFAAIALAVLFIGKVDEVQQGWFTFNAVLCAIAMSGTHRRDGAFVLLAVFISVLLESLMQNLGVIYLTFPFIAACWITLFIKGRYLKAFPA